ncbi:4-hydroxybenzoyl-CoA reductase subunit gamma [Planctomycetes bacterium Pla163]|uniref:4-hydroxybenzoyl-CoA reductase subunit gamma n=1 Tax=Rohdeia mirabilis TaxID=2528008 RepID=A0A518CVY6_9BACT|nr:4-hydroxybenzoyl-CoA reductase subunit gamma [Planctomycetes bacterium Pla163]
MTDRTTPDGRDDAPPQGATSSAPAPLSRRSFLKGASTVAAGGAAIGQALAAQTAAAQAEQEAASRGTTLSGKVDVTLAINGREQKLSIEPRTTLLSALRHHLERPLTGTKEVCDRGNCGACSVLIDGEPAYSCLQLAVRCAGKQITTVEGLGSPDAMSDVQAAFVAKDAQMCGFCTPGFVIATTACLSKHPDADRDTIRTELSGNLCRCGTYGHLFDAAEAVRDGRTGAKSEGGSKR